MGGEGLGAGGRGLTAFGVSPMNRTVEIAPAKLNLGLRILGRRPDGYQDIVSVLLTVDLCDRLVFTPAPPGETRVFCDNPDLPGGPENLVHRAVEILRRATGAGHGVRVDLNKRIPMGAGLGGGSSNAATALRALDRLWGLDLRPERLAALAAELGSDVPFFLTGGTAVVTGRGERIRPVDWEGDFWYVLVYPRVSRIHCLGLSKRENWLDRYGGVWYISGLFGKIRPDLRWPIVRVPGKRLSAARGSRRPRRGADP